MADLTGMMQAAAGNAGAGVGSYVAAIGWANPYITLLDHSVPGTLTYSSSYNPGVYPSSVAFSPDNAYVALQTTATLRLLNQSDGVLSVATTYTVAGTVNNSDVAFSPDGTYIAIATDGTGTGNVTLLDHSTPGTLSYLSYYNSTSKGFISCAFSPDGNYIALGHYDGTSPYFTLLNNSAGTLSLATTYALNGLQDAPKDISFSPDGSYIAVGSDKGLTLLNHSAGSVSLATTYAINLSGYGSFGCDFHPSGDYIAVGTLSNLILLDHTTPGTLSLSSTVATGQVSSASWNGTGDYLASFVRADPEVRLMDHTTPGTLSQVATYNLASVTVFGGLPIAFSKAV